MVTSSAFMHDHYFYYFIILLFSYIHIQKYITSTTYYTIRHNLIAVRRAGIPDQDGLAWQWNEPGLYSIGNSLQMCTCARIGRISMCTHNCMRENGIVYGTHVHV